MTAPEPRPNVGAHTLSLVSSFIEGGWHAECSCGWRSRKRADVMAAQYDGHDHAVAAEAAP